MAVYERPTVPQGNTIDLRATPLQDSITQVAIYQGGTAGVPGTGTLVATITTGITISGQEYVAQWAVPNAQATGTYYDDWTYIFNGVTQPVVRLAGFTVVNAVVLGTGAPPGYPYTYGYCQYSDVQERINSSVWTGVGTGQIPTQAQVQGWITQEAAKIDMVLAKRGYTVPLTVASGYSQIDPRAYSLLLDINAALAAARVLGYLHGTTDISEDPEATALLRYADDYLVRIEEGQDNLTYFGVAGLWNPDPNPVKSGSSGGLYDPDSPTGMTQPFFTRTKQF